MIYIQEHLLATFTKAHSHSSECTLASGHALPTELAVPVTSDMGMLTSVSETQKQLEKLDPSDDKYRLLLRELLSHQDLKPHIHGLDGPGLEGFVELLDKVGEADRDPPTVSLTLD